MTGALKAGNKSPSGRTAAGPKQPALKRQVFEVSRELEYFSESELVTQTGYPREQWWPGVFVKELVDNALDACEQSGIATHIKVAFDGRELVVEDNGPGLPADVVERILDFSSRTSDKAAYVSPTRGCQGNAAKTLLAMPYVLGGGLVEIEACGIQHQIRVSTDQIAQRPRIDHHQSKIVKRPGSVIRVVLDSASSIAQTSPSRNPESYKSFSPTIASSTRMPGSIWWTMASRCGSSRRPRVGGSGCRRIPRVPTGTIQNGCADCLGATSPPNPMVGGCAPSASSSASLGA